MAGTKLVREERVPTVEIAEVAHGDPALMSRARRLKSVHPDQTVAICCFPSLLVAHGTDACRALRDGCSILSARAEHTLY
jgi:hypothetical protein